MTAASMGTVAGELNDETLGKCDIIVLACYPKGCIEWLEAHAQALADVTSTTERHHGPFGNSTPWRQGPNLRAEPCL